MLPKRRFGKEEQKMKSRFSMDFSMIRRPNRVLTPLKNASKIRISSFVQCSSFQNLRLGSINVRYLMVLYARLFAIPMVLTIGRQLTRTSMNDSSGKRVLRRTLGRALRAYACDVSVATMRLSIGVFCAQTYLTLVDAFRCPGRIDYMVASAVATGLLMVRESSTRRVLITRQCAALFVCMLVKHSPLKRWNGWRFVFALLLCKSIRMTLRDSPCSEQKIAQFYAPQTKILEGGTKDDIRIFN